jgi:DNA invertase Pin-like site-specific DNA recombinase
MIIGYARVSTDDQNTDAQVEALRAAGCEKIVTETASGGRWDRPELQALLKFLRKGDILVVWKLDRLSRSLKDLLSIMEQLAKLDAGFRSITESLDTTTAAGELMLHIVAAFAQFERSLIRERTKAGLAIARREGRVGGRRSALNPAQQRRAIDDVSSGRETVASCARVLGVHSMTIRRLLERQQEHAS